MSLSDSEEDVDFNPLLKEPDADAASSSLSSEVEGDLVVESNCNPIEEEEEEDEDAICRRTRARYSLASFTLDELETFLQETDDEDDFHNANDEEEYRKFLAAVLHGSLAAEDEEDNDADFELEIEEALETDPEEEDEEVAVHARPNTRRIRPSLGHLNRPLPLLLPYHPAHPLPTPSNVTAFFTPHQIGQLHCLIHEHVQLLIQVFSVCALDPARRHIASDVGELISQLVHQRDQVVTTTTRPHPSFCFFPPYVGPSIFDQPSTDNPVWMPYVSGPIVSVLDVAPLKLAKGFINDVSHAAEDHHRQQIERSDDSCSQKEPLFPLRNAHFTAESNAVPPPKVQTPKKTMAAVLIEQAKKEQVALVPKVISKLAQRFCPLFNPALYPHKPPPAAVANRVLFTDAEDKLLALGLMECNTDWKVIQQRYLPCKSKHQIFVRQKNRSSSKAPENPIKAVRRIKNSPLTAEEVARIEEGLKVFRRDWMSVWKFMVPYRDPALLLRQWRIAIGTQKSYKSNAIKKEKRRLYALRKRKLQAAASETWNISREEDDVAVQAVGENNGADNCVDKDVEAYVHEAFLADLRPAVSRVEVNHCMSDLAEKTPQRSGEESSQIADQMNGSGSRNGQSQISDKFPTLRRLEAKFSSRPYQADKFDYRKLVQLAPGLPPVNLPPSVRVMSQSAFRRYLGGKYPRAFGGDACTDYNTRVCNAPKIASVAKKCPTHFVKGGPFSSNAGKHSTGNQNLHESSVSKDNTSVIGGKDESGLQLHPLFFRALEDGHLPFNQSNSSFSTCSSFNFFSSGQPQVNLSLFHHPRQTAQTVNFLDKSSLLGDKASVTSGSDFHPLLQRTNDANCDLEVPSSAAVTSFISESSRGRCSEVEKDIDGSSDVACPIPSSPMRKNNEVDLEMHLSFTPRKQKAMESRRVADHHMERSDASAYDFGDQNPPNNRTPNRTTQHVSGATTVILSSDEENGNDVDYTADQSHAEIVMEQEELSDSEEETGEGVEFECEEMEDSEGEETFESEQIRNGKNEEMDKVSLDESSDPSVPNKHGNSKGNSCSTSGGHTTSLVLIDKVTEDQPSPRCLNLNSPCPVSPQATSTSGNLGVSAGKAQARTSSRRSKKNARQDSDCPAVPRIASDVPMPSQCSIVSSQRKSRKRSRRMNSRKIASSLIDDRNLGSPKITKKDEVG